MKQKFDDWWELNYPPEKFGTLSGVFRLGLKELAEKAFKEGLALGHDGIYDRNIRIASEQYLRTEK